MLKRIIILICGLLILTSTTLYSQCEPASGKQSCASITCPNPINNCVPVGANFDFVTGDYFVLECNCLTPDECYVELPTGGLPGCVIPDNGSGTADLPPLGCQYESLDDVWMIIDGLPPGTTIEMVGILYDFNSIVSGPGGSLGGEFEQFDALLDLTVSGTGDLTGFNRHLSIPLSCETHSGPRNPGDATQIFPAVMYQLQGQLFGDPDFCTFNMMGGTNYGLPSPGETKLRELPSGHFAVESFFDVTYQIEFEGCPGSILEGLSGVTTATIRIQTGEIPACVGGCPPGETCVETITENPDGTIDVSCECIPLVCEPTVDGSGCKTETCANPSEDCLPVCAELDLLTGDIVVTECECKDAGCYLDLSTTIVNTCVNPDNGIGTADLPPAGCQYESPDDVWMIIDGLPPGTTIEMEGILMSFSNLTATPGGSLGGEIETFDSYLDLTVSGTGMLAGFNRHLSVPVSAETHSGPRNPGDPAQNFPTDMFELFGELFGDPDFCTFRVIGGTNYGLPSPGQTKLTQLPSGDFAVESFFDITYQIEFEGCPGSMLDGFMGTTTATIRMQTGTTPPECAGECPPGWSCEQIITYNVDGTIDVCCECINETCDCIPGEADETPPINILDIVLLINFKYKGGPSPAPYALCNCDATCNCVCDILDIVHVINFKYKGGAAPCSCNTWVTNCGTLRK